MWILTWLTALALGSVFFARQEAQSLNPNAHPNSTTQGNVVEVSLKRGSDGHYRSGGTINGYPVEFLLDTGASSVAVPLHLAERLGLPRGMRIGISTAKGDGIGYLTHIKDLRIGDLHLSDVEGTLMPEVDDNDILLGMSALRDLEFSQQAGILLLRKRQ